jgi:hypothetical protein
MGLPERRFSNGRNSRATGAGSGSRRMIKSRCLLTNLTICAFFTFAYFVTAMPHRTRPRPAVLSGIEKVRNKPLPNVQPMEQYRALQGNKIRQYYAVGDPVQHMHSSASTRRLGLVLAGIFFAVLVIGYLVMR